MSEKQGPWEHNSKYNVLRHKISDRHLLYAHDIVDTLNALEAQVERLREACDSLLSNTIPLQHGSGYVVQRASLDKLKAAIGKDGDT